MTKHKLKQIRRIKNEIRAWRQKLDEISNPLPGRGLDGMPHGSGGTHSAIEAHAIKSVELEQQIQSLLEELEETESEIMNFIIGIDDSFIRMIIKCRYLDGMSWANTAAAIGPGTSPESCKMTLTRWFAANNIS